MALVWSSMASIWLTEVCNTWGSILYGIRDDLPSFTNVERGHRDVTTHYPVSDRTPWNILRYLLAWNLWCQKTGRGRFVERSGGRPIENSRDVGISKVARVVMQGWTVESWVGSLSRCWRPYIWCPGHVSHQQRNVAVEEFGRSDPRRNQCRI